MIDYLWHDYHGMTMESVLINCHYPVTPDSFLLQWGVIVKRPPGLSDAHGDKIAAKFADFVGLGFQQDVAIWTHKTRIDNPLLCAEDGPVYQLRRWYEQFYIDVDDITPDMVERYEFEVDTTRAVADWEAEVAANLAARRSELTMPGVATDERRRRRSGRVECDRCAAAVLVVKFSLQHTSVQWTAESVRACAEFTARAAAGEQTALIATCASLRDSIDAAVSRGPRGGVPAVSRAARPTTRCRSPR